ncbi:MAG: hypothetical protein ACRD12_11395 [Acidimicrobiales bacterium]
MPRVKDTPRNRRLQAELEQTRRAIRAAVDELISTVGLTQGQIAKQAGWNAGYLSEFIRAGAGTESSKMPQPAKVEALVRSLLDVCYRLQFQLGEARMPIEEALLETAERYGFTWRERAHADGPIPPDAPNHVARSCERDALELLDKAGLFLVVGEPLSGKTCLAGTILHSAARSERVTVHVDSARVYMRGSSETEILTGLVEAVTGQAVQGARFEVDAQLSDWVAESGGRGVTLVLDNINDGPVKSVELMKGILKEWGVRATSPLPVNRSWRRFAAWSVGTSDLTEVQIESMRTFPIGRHVVCRWFEPNEVVQLARSFAPPMAGRSADRWGMEVAADAWKKFSGQPHLTHVYIEARANGTEADDPARFGPFARHLERLAAILRTAPDVKAAVSKGGDLEYHDTLRQLGLCERGGGWRCAWYGEHFPDHFLAGGP